MGRNNEVHRRAQRIHRCRTKASIRGRPSTTSVQVQTFCTQHGVCQVPILVLLLLLQKRRTLVRSSHARRSQNLALEGSRTSVYGFDMTLEVEPTTCTESTVTPRSPELLPTATAIWLPVTEPDLDPSRSCVLRKLPPKTARESTSSSCMTPTSSSHFHERP